MEIKNSNKGSFGRKVILIRIVLEINFVKHLVLSLQEKSKLETDNLVSNLPGNRIPDGLEMEFSVSKTLVSNCVRLNYVFN